jgi:hypothetical protein
LPEITQPGQHFFEWAAKSGWYATVKLHHRLVVTLIHVVDDPDRMRPNGVSDTSSPGMRIKPPGKPRYPHDLPHPMSWIENFPTRFVRRIPIAEFFTGHRSGALFRYRSRDINTLNALNLIDLFVLCP